MDLPVTVQTIAQCYLTFMASVQVISLAHSAMLLNVAPVASIHSTISRLIYASPAWSGFTTATDRQRVDAFLRRSKRCGFCPPEVPDYDQLLEEADDQLFKKILNNPNHTLHQLLPPQSTASQKYNLRRRAYDRQLHEHQGHLIDCNFITRLLYRNSY